MNQKDELLVSILMTSYNRELFIADAIESVLQSTFKDFELIIVDDASTDNTYTMAQEYAESDQRIRLFRNKENLGQFRNRNKAASLARGNYLMHADSDDMIYPNGIENCVNVMIEFPEAGFGMFYDNEGKPLLLKPEAAIRKHFFEKPFLTHGPGATIIRRDIFEQIGGFPLSYSVAGDMYYNLNAASHTPTLLIPFRFIDYRIHEGQEINNKFDYLWANFKYLKDALEKLPLNLKDSESKWIANKNRRRFILNILNYVSNELQFRSSIKAIKLSGFTIVDLMKGFFHFN